jgi:NitT/TauT family transport system substrate-binding protein
MRRCGFLIAALALVACGSPTPPPEALRIAVLPILDTLPLYVAEARGYFSEADVKVTFVTAVSAAERDQLLQAGRVDGVITDLVALALYNRQAEDTAEVRLIAVRTAMVPSPTMPQFRILASGEWLGRDVQGVISPTVGSLVPQARAEVLQGIPIGVSEGTVVAYVTDRLLRAEGLQPEEIVTLAVPKISDRMALLKSGELRAATLPEPLASLAVQEGAVVVVDDTQHPEYSTSVFAFHKAVLETRQDALRGFLAAVERASLDINADKARWQALLVEKKLVPPALEGAYVLPDYPAARQATSQSAPGSNTTLIPTLAQFADVLRWLEAHSRLVDVPYAYRDVVNDSFLPQ